MMILVFTIFIFVFILQGFECLFRQWFNILRCVLPFRRSLPVKIHLFCPFLKLAFYELFLNLKVISTLGQSP